MMKDIVVGLGTAGGRVADKFSTYKAYDEVWIIDHEESDVFDIVNPDINFIKIEKQEDGDKEYAHERYEGNYSQFKEFAESRKNQNIYFIVSGASDISGCSLSFLMHLDKEDINLRVIYLKPDVDFISRIERMQEKVTRNVLQQYARSGKLREVFLIANKSVEDYLDGVAIKEYFSKLNEAIAYNIHMINYCRNTRPEYDNLSSGIDHMRIRTVGMADGNGNEILFYPMNKERNGVEFPVEKFYYYLIGEERLENDVDLLKDIKKSMLNKKKGLMEVSYAIFSSSDEDQIMFDYSTSLVQE